MKRMLLVVVALLTACAAAGCASGSAEPQQVAEKYLPEGVEFVREETDDGFTVLEYKDSASGSYELTMDGQSVIALEYDSGVRPAAQQPTLTQEQAFAVVSALHPNATLLSAVSGPEDAGYEWTVIFEDGDTTGVYEIDAATGSVLDSSVFYGASEGVDPANAVITRYPGAEITHIDLELDDGRLTFEGHALLDGAKYDFSVDYKTGVVTEWERDN